MFQKDDNEHGHSNHKILLFQPYNSGHITYQDNDTIFWFFFIYFFYGKVSPDNKPVNETQQEVISAGVHIKCSWSGQFLQFTGPF